MSESSGSFDGSPINEEEAKGNPKAKSTVVNRRTILKGLVVGAGTALFLKGDSSPSSSSEQDHSESSRPVTIVVDAREKNLSGRMVQLRELDFGSVSSTITPEMEKNGYYNSTLFGQVGYEETAYVDPDSMQFLNNALAPLNGLRADDSEIQVGVFRLPQGLIDWGLNFEASPVLDPADKLIGIRLKPDTQYPIEFIRMIAFHERLHTIHSAPGFEFPASIDDTLMQLSEDAKKIADANKEILPDATKENPFQSIYDYGPELKALGPLANVLAESSYLKFDDNIGHPTTDTHELWASTLNVAHFYPRSLRMTMEGLAPNDRELIRNHVRDTIQSLRNYTDNPEKVDALFADELLEYVRK